MWNDFNTKDYNGMRAEVCTIPSADGEQIQVYMAQPLTEGKHPGIVLIPHMPGWDEWCRECARRFAEHGYTVICPNIYEKFGHGTPVEVSGMAREAGGCADSDVMSITQDCINFLKASEDSNNKVGVIGMCSGGRHAFLAACSCENLDAAVDCWGPAVTAPERTSPKQPVQPLDLAENISCPICGIFGNEDQFPTPEVVDIMEAKLKELGKDYEFHRYDGAGHGIWYYDKPMYRQEQAMDSFNVVNEFFDRNLK